MGQACIKSTSFSVLHACVLVPLIDVHCERCYINAEIQQNIQPSPCLNCQFLWCWSEEITWPHCTVDVFQPGMSPHDAIQVPFVLLPESQNEGQFAFQVESISMPQKMKGTVTYILKVRQQYNVSLQSVDVITLNSTSYIHRKPRESVSDILELVFLC